MRDISQIGPGFMRMRYVTFVSLRVVGFLMVVGGTTSLAASMCMVPVLMDRPGNDPPGMVLLMMCGGMAALLPGAGIMFFSRPLAAYLVPLPREECPGCGYSLRDIESDRCPECGVQLPVGASRDGRDRGDAASGSEGRPASDDV